MKPDETGDGKPRKKPGRKPKPPEKPPEPAGDASELDAVEPAPDVLPDDFFATPLPSIRVKDNTATAEDLLDPQERAHIERQKKRAVMATEVARHCWNIACGPHRLESGDPLAFDDYPFQIDMFQDASPDQVHMGATQYGKTERLICYAIACAVAGLKVMFICSKEDARERLVKTRIDPALRSVPQYRRLVAQAQAKGKSTDSARIKQIGAGSINFANAQSRDQMYGTPADVLLIDEYQLCNQDHLAIANNRLDGSDYYFKVIAGNPLTKGSESNQNLHYQYLQSDQKQWHVPCDNCGEAQILEWWTHVVNEEKNQGGAILSVKPMDPEWDPDGPLDMRPVCQFCKSPMNRLHPGGFWKAMNPTHPRSGRQISNIYNAKKPLRMRYDQYRLALNSPMRVANFVNNQLGTYYEMEGSSISESMILNCTKGDAATGLAPYRMVPAGMIEWRDTDPDAA